MLFASGCAADAPVAEPPLGEVRPLAAPSGPNSAQPHLARGPRSAILSWLEMQPDSSYALRFSRLAEDSWSEPRTVVQSDSFFVNWADFPSVVALPDRSLVAHWLARSGPATYAYDVRTARSADGVAWSEPVTIHDDGTQTEHGFATLLPLADGSAAAFWLDGRKYAQNAENAAHGAGEMTLRYATLEAGGISAAASLDQRTCDCCQTDAAVTTNGPVVVYRDRSPGEIRDIAIVRWINGAWSEPAAVYPDNWHIAACPVNGPAIDAADELVVVAWFTAADDVPRVKVAFSDDAGATFDAPVQADDGDPAGRVGVQLLPDGSALLQWLERDQEDAEVRVRRITRHGLAGPSQTVAAASGSRASGFPQMLRMGNRVIFAWTETGEPSQVRTAVADLAAVR